MESKSTTNPTTQQLTRHVTAALQQPPRRLTTTTVVQQKPTNAIHDLLAGGIAGSAGIFVGHPLDSLKVRMQMSSGGGGSSIRTILSQSSTLGSVWNGLPAPLAGAAALNACIFLTYGSTTRLWDKYDTTNGNNVDESKSLAKEAICGGITGFVSSFIMCPTEHIKTKQQLNATMYRNSFHATQQIFTTHGFVGLNRGFVATAIRQSPGFCVYFGTYERLKDSLQTHNNIKCSQLIASILAGGFAGSFSWAIVYPIDLIKSRIQALPMDCSKNDRSIVHIGKSILKESGWKALYRGFGITVLRAFPVNAVILTTHSELRGLFERTHVR
ncbi:mitochondrial carrier protein [Skeletonema marinoi]|uniref:Mitochondrial carrier protein n=1 Tax=Skeletonema marinoi TaxID=267567 RepID=A0AAD8Y274_9STRA|nr:mitochondrial carrier protein [Skeletonema marinoi]